MSTRIKITPELLITLLFCVHCILLFANSTKYFNLVGSYYGYLVMIPLFSVSVRYCNSKSQLIVGVIILYTLLSFWIKGGTQILAVFLFWVVIFFCVGFRVKPKHFLYIKAAYCISSFIMSVLLLAQRRHPYTGSDSSRYGLFFSTTGFYDVNFMSTFLTIPTIIMFVAVFDKKVKYFKVTVSALIVNLLAIYLLGSRSGLFVVFVSIFAYAVISRNKPLRSKILYFIIGILFLLFVMQFLPTDTISRLLNKGIIDGKTSTRYISWMYGLEAFRENPIWGNGLYSTVELIDKTNPWGTAYTAHNTFISFLAMYGIAGSIPIGLFLMAPVYYALKYKYNLYFLILYGGFLAQLFVIEAGFSEIMLIPLMFFWIYINSRGNKIMNHIHF